MAERFNVAESCVRNLGIRFPGADRRDRQHGRAAVHRLAGPAVSDRARWPVVFKSEPGAVRISSGGIGGGAAASRAMIRGRLRANSNYAVIA